MRKRQLSEAENVHVASPNSKRPPPPPPQVCATCGERGREFLEYQKQLKTCNKNFKRQQKVQSKVEKLRRRSVMSKTGFGLYSKSVGNPLEIPCTVSLGAGGGRPATTQTPQDFRCEKVWIWVVLSVLRSFVVSSSFRPTVFEY